MKRVILFTLLLPTVALASDARVLQYGCATKVDFALYKLDGTGLKTDAVSASGDIQIMKDEGTEGATSGDAFTDEGQGYSLNLTATEMSASRIQLYIVDQSGPQVWLDKVLSIQTVGSSLTDGTAAGGGTSSITLSAAASNTNNYYKGRQIELTAGTGAGQNAVIRSYNGTSKVATIYHEGTTSGAWSVQPDTTSCYAIVPDGPVNVRWTNDVKAYGGSR